MLLISLLAEAVERAKTLYHRLVLVAGPAGSGKTPALRELAAQKGYGVLNVNFLLSQRMLELTKAQRSRQVERLLKELVDGGSTDVLVLDNLEILFDTNLRIDPLRLLQAASRNRTLVAAWNGTVEDGTLTYAVPDHPEYRSYKNVAAIIVQCGQTASTTT